VGATTTTTIPGVSLVTRQLRPAGDVFDLALSPDGIEVRRPGRPAQHLPWSRVSQWEVEERPGSVLLTLRGEGATTPLVIPGWTLDDLELLLRELTAESGGPTPAPAPGTDPAPAAPLAPPLPPASGPRAARRRQRRRHRLTGKAVVTIVLLGALAVAVAVVLLQSAGVIDWGFLGPTA